MTSPIEKKIASRLIEENDRTFFRNGRIVYPEGCPQENVVSDLKRYPHAFLIGNIMNNRMSGEKAFVIPARIQSHFGDSSFEFLFKNKERVRRFFVAENLHRHPEKMATRLIDALKYLKKYHEGNASEIWKGSPPSAAVISRFLGFDGVNQKISSLAANMLYRNYKIPFSDHQSIDIGVDVHVQRVFSRLGLIKENEFAKSKIIPMIVFKARELNPDYPGALDYPVWRVGEKWCRPKNPECDACMMKKLCPSKEQFNKD